MTYMLRDIDKVLFDGLMDFYSKADTLSAWPALSNVLHVYNYELSGSPFASDENLFVKNFYRASEFFLNNKKDNSALWCDYEGVYETCLEHIRMKFPSINKLLLADMSFNIYTYCKENFIVDTLPFENYCDKVIKKLAESPDEVSKNISNLFKFNDDHIKSLESNPFDEIQYVYLCSNTDKLRFYDKFYNDIASALKYSQSEIQNKIKECEKCIDRSRYLAAAQIMSEMDMGLLGDEIASVYKEELGKEFIIFAGISGAAQAKDTEYFNEVIRKLYKYKADDNIPGPLFAYMCKSAFGGGEYQDSCLTCMTVERLVKDLWQRIDKASDIDRLTALKNNFIHMKNNLYNMVVSMKDALDSGLVFEDKKEADEIKKMLETLNKYKHGMTKAEKIINNKIQLIKEAEKFSKETGALSFDFDFDR